MINWRKPIVYLLLYLSGSKIPRNLGLIKKLDKLSFEEKKKYQDEKLKKLLLHSYKNVPYYTNILKDAKVVMGDDVNLDNFKNIPILTKEIIRKEGENMYFVDYKNRKPYENTSGGSTGEPVRFLQDKNYSDWNIASKIFLKYKVGQIIGEKELRFWGSERDLLEGKEKLLIRLRNWLYNRREFNTFKMSEKEMREYVDKWNDFKPNWVESYVQSIYEFAKFLKANDLKIHSPKNGILTSAGTLYPEMKELIEEVFCCIVYNRYGSREVGNIACGRNSLDLDFWDHRVETIENDRIIITLFSNFSMPLIRYDIGDVGVLNNEFELEKIKGRSVNLFKTENGELIDGEFFTHEFYFKDWCKKFQVIQKEYNLINIKIVGVEDENDMDKIEKEIKIVMGNNCEINWDFVNDIEPTKSGKYLYTICEI